jgi:hypothetical protein
MARFEVKVTCTAGFVPTILKTASWEDDVQETREDAPRDNNREFITPSRPEES